MSARRLAACAPIVSDPPREVRGAGYVSVGVAPLMQVHVPDFLVSGAHADPALLPTLALVALAMPRLGFAYRDSDVQALAAHPAFGFGSWTFHRNRILKAALLERARVHGLRALWHRIDQQIHHVFVPTSGYTPEQVGRIILAQTRDLRCAEWQELRPAAQAGDYVEPVVHALILGRRREPARRERSQQERRLQRLRSRATAKFTAPVVSPTPGPQTPKTPQAAPPPRGASRLFAVGKPVSASLLQAALQRAPKPIPKPAVMHPQLALQMWLDKGVPMPADAPAAQVGRVLVGLVGELAHVLAHQQCSMDGLDVASATAVVELLEQVCAGEGGTSTQRILRHEARGNPRQLALDLGAALFSMRTPYHRVDPKEIMSGPLEECWFIQEGLLRLRRAKSTLPKAGRFAAEMTVQRVFDAYCKDAHRGSQTWPGFAKPTAPPARPAPAGAIGNLDQLAEIQLARRAELVGGAADEASALAVMCSTEHDLTSPEGDAFLMDAMNGRLKAVGETRLGKWAHEIRAIDQSLLDLGRSVVGLVPPSERIREAFSDPAVCRDATLMVFSRWSTRQSRPGDPDWGAQFDHPAHRARQEG